MMKFTGHERDFHGSAQDLDYMHARFSSPLEARFLTVDPLLNAEKVAGEPQLWNRYTYVTNNPLKYVDNNGEERLISRSALPSPVYARENAAAAAQFAREVSHYDDLGEAWKGAKGAPANEKAMAVGVAAISIADIGSWFLGGAEEKGAAKAGVLLDENMVRVNGRCRNVGLTDIWRDGSDICRDNDEEPPLAGGSSEERRTYL
jgi:RHS repeat-associated protein